MAESLSKNNISSSPDILYGKKSDERVLSLLNSGYDVLITEYPEGSIVYKRPRTGRLRIATMPQYDTPKKIIRKTLSTPEKNNTHFSLSDVRERNSIGFYQLFLY